MKVSSGKATVTRLQMNRQGGYGEVKFWWKGEDAAKETELVVRGYVNAVTGGPPVLPARRQMAVCTFLHTKGEMSVLSVQNKDGEIFVERLTEKI